MSNYTETLLKQIVKAVTSGGEELVQQFTETVTNDTITLPDNTSYYSVKNVGTDDVTVDLGAGGSFALIAGEAYTSNPKIQGYLSIAINAETSSAKVVYETRN